jgi:hypothetical protein
MRDLRVLILPTPAGATIRATDGCSSLLRATLPMPWHAQALPALLEALGRFHPLPVRAALVVDASAASFATSLYPGWFPDFGGGLYELEVVSHRGRRERGGR